METTGGGGFETEDVVVDVLPEDVVLVDVTVLPEDVVLVLG